MSNETDLDWLARNVPLEQVRGWIQKVGEGFNIVTSGMPPAIFGQPAWFSAREVLARRAELQNKPTKWPKRANWLAQHEDGEWTFYADDVGCPPQRSDDGCWYSDRAALRSHHIGEVLGDWRDTLERRPDMHKSEPKIDTSAERVQKTEEYMHVSARGNDWFERGELPPAGTECEIFCDEEWMKVFVVGSNRNGDAVVELDDGNIVPCVECTFRPIRTEREVAIEEMCNAAGLDGLVFGLVAGKLYDAGYRKESK